MATCIREYCSIDALRFFACIAVICIHTGPFDPAVMDEPNRITHALFYAIQTLSLCAVPFFFCVSGFFFAGAVRERGPLRAAWRFVRRNYGLFLVWSLLYRFTPPLDSVKHQGVAAGYGAELAAAVRSLIADPARFLFFGWEIHLWFLASLCLAAVICAVMYRAGLGRWVLPVAAVVYLLGLTNQGYAGLDLPFALHTNTRVGPWFALLPFALGMAAGKRDFLRWMRSEATPDVLRPGRIGPLLALAGLGCIVAEYELLHHFFRAGTAQYYLGSAVAALGLVLWAADRPERFRATPLPALGRLSAGVYLTHMFLVNLIQTADLDFLSAMWWQPTFPVLVCGLCLLAARAARWRLRSTGTRSAPMGPMPLQ